MRRVAKLSIIAIVVLAGAAPDAMASRMCDELWFIRNSVMDKAGYCFGSALGKAQFNNSDCTGQQITLTLAQTAFVTEIRRLESTFGCAVNTARTTLQMSDLAVRKRLEHQPVPHEEDNMVGWGCLGYVGSQVPLHAGPNAASAQVGRIEPGDWVGVGGHKVIDGWVYVRTHGPYWESFRSGGWMPTESPMSCEDEAG